MRFICLRLLYHKSNRRKPTRRYAVLLPVAKGFGDKMSSDRRVTAYRAYARDNPLMRFICLRLLYHKSNRRKPTRRYAVLLPVAKGFGDKMSSDRRVTAYRAYARDNPLMRFICLRLLYHKSNRRKPTRRYAVLLPVAKGFGDKMFSDRRVTAYRAYARDNPLMRFICLRLLYHTVPIKPLPKWVK